MGLLWLPESASSEASSRLDKTTKLDTLSGWFLSVYPEAAEAVGVFRYQRRRPTRPGPYGGNPERSVREAERRARGKIRRFAVANGINRLTTVTYRGEGCHDPRLVRDHWSKFTRTVRRRIGIVPYVVVPELHPLGHGFHLHMGLNLYVPKRLLEEAWGRGFVDVRAIRVKRKNLSAHAQARVASQYLAKYIGKESTRVAGLHRYEVSQGFQPRKVEFWGRTSDEVLDQAIAFINAKPVKVWYSTEMEAWDGPLAMTVSWE